MPGQETHILVDSRVISKGQGLYLQSGLCHSLGFELNEAEAFRTIIFKLRQRYVLDIAPLGKYGLHGVDGC